MTSNQDIIATVFPKVENIKYLASGGQKSVYSGQHPDHGQVVIKIFEKDSDLQRIEREIKAMTIMQLHSTPRIFEYAHYNDDKEYRFVLIEQMIVGKTLSDIIKHSSPIDPSKVIDYGYQILSIISEAESKSIVHRDIKPSNIIIDSSNKLWLFDYGIARHLEMDSLTNTSDILGASTPGYAPIEQFKNRKGDINSRSDLFAVGVTLFELLNGSNPFYKDAKGPLDVLDKVENERLPRLSNFTSDGELEDLIYELTQPQQEHRPVSAKDAFNWIAEIKDS